MADLVINDTTGGLSTLSPTSMYPNQCSEARNVEWVKTKCGERRKGHSAITLGGGLEDCHNLVWMHRHLPTSDESASQLWAMGVKTVLGVLTPVLAYKDTSWHTVTMPDTLTLGGGVNLFKVDAVSFHGKLFIAYKSGVDRLHVFITGDTALRRTGIAAPAAPTAAETGAGTIDDERTYRVRYTEQIAGVTVRRSEPSAELNFVPTSASGVTVTKPAALSEGETHWEIEATKLDGLWYRIATIAVGTTTYDDTIADDTSYSTVGTLSEDIGDYTLIPSVRYLSVDNDRLMTAGSFDTEVHSARVSWTPVGLASGVGNDERLESDTDPFVDLDYLDGGGITAISRVVNGYLYVTKMSQTFQGLRTRDRARAYSFLALTKERGAVAGTMVESVDNNGHPCLFALDRDVGPVRIGGENGGVQTCGNDLVELWRQYGQYVASSENTTQKGIYYRKNKQIMWAFPSSNFRLVLHTQYMRDDTEHGFRSGWAFWTHGVGSIEGPLVLYSDNIEAGIARSANLVPFLGMSASLDAQIWQGDTGYLDNGSPFIATLTTRQYVPDNYTNEFEIKEAAIFGLSAANFVAKVTVKGRRADKTLVQKSTNVNFSGEAPDFYYEHGHTIRRLDDLGVGELNTVFIEIMDQLNGSGLSISQGWGLDAIVLPLSRGQTRGSQR